MALTITLSSGGSSEVKPGELICGTVKFVSNSECYVESVSISFIGQTIVSLSQQSTTDSSAPHSSCGILFRLHLILQGSQQFYSKGTKVWPFAFIIPSHATFTPGASAEFFECESPWRGSSDAETLLLPPSMFYKAGFTCAVQYGLQARLIRPPTAHMLGWNDLSAYTVVRLRPTPTIADHPGNMSSGDYQSVDLTIRESGHWKTVFPRLSLASTDKSHEPKYQLDSRRQITLYVFLPRTILQNSSSPVQVLLRASVPDINQQQESISIRKFDLDLVLHTKVRASWKQETSNRLVALIRHNYQKEIPLVSQYQNETFNEHIYSISLEGKMMSSLSFDMLPEFCTYNIFRSYTLRFKLQLKHGRKNITLLRQDIPISIYAAQTSELRNKETPGVDRDIRSLFEGRAFLPSSGSDEFDGPPPDYC
ncbi:hypothetical protein F5884DRAFT_873473 [Xylogone sp. PMI_703]|nr:hypothetical protein F5884DRAFT_873473 [Xylogone sp. PMI_703]